MSQPHAFMASLLIPKGSRPSWVSPGSLQKPPGILEPGTEVLNVRNIIPSRKIFKRRENTGVLFESLKKSLGTNENMNIYIITNQNYKNSDTWDSQSLELSSTSNTVTYFLLESCPPFFQLYYQYFKIYLETKASFITPAFKSVVTKIY